MYNIKQAAARAGVSVPVLRAWERRYGIVSPERTASNYRQFDDAAVARVRTMRAMVDAGWSPSTAAAAILAGEVPVDVAAPAPAGAVTGPGSDSSSTPSGTPGSTSTDDAEGLANRLVAAAAALDAEAVDAVLDDLFARGSFERVATDLLFPALERLGTAWARGEVSVAGEHLASSAVHRRLALALEAAGSALPGRPVVIGLPPGSRHELGALAFAVAARRAGLPVAYLGADLPIDDWVVAADGAAAAVVGVVTARDRATARQVADRLAATRPGLPVAFGGRHAEAVDGVVHLPPTLATSVAALRERLEGSARQAGPTQRAEATGGADAAS